MAAAPPPVQGERRLLAPGENFTNQLAAAVRSIEWSYAIFWSISTSRPGVLTWNDGFYNGEIKTRKITNSTDLTADQLILQRSEQLRELYDSLLSGECDHRARRPVASLSPEDLGDTEWYYVVCMTYAFRPGHGLPGKSFASNEFVWLSNVQSANTRAFPRALLAKSASVQTIVCIPFMSGVLELGTTNPVSEDAGLVNRISASFWELEFPANETGDADVDVDAFEDHLDIHNGIEEAIVPAGEHRLGDAVECAAADANPFEQIAVDIDELYSLCEELDVPVLDDSSWLMAEDGCFHLVPSCPESAPAPAATVDDGDFVVALCKPDCHGGARSGGPCFVAWKRTEYSDDGGVAAAVVVTGGDESQKLLKKVVGGGAWMDIAGGGTARTQESGIKNHVMSERRRREKLNEMFLILKSLVPSIHKVDKASILAETIAYLKELERRVRELESSVQPSRPPEPRLCRRRELARNSISATAGAKRKASSEFVGGDVDTERHWVVLSKDGAPSSNVVVNVTVMDKEVRLEVQCPWKELLMARVFDAIKGLGLDVLSVQASTPDGLLGLDIRAKFRGSAAVAPGMISEALREAIGS